MEAKHTPGPWTVEQSKCNSGNITYSFRGNSGLKVITDTSPFRTGEPTIFSVSSREFILHQGKYEDQELLTGFENCTELPHEANAKLIAAAPDLLELVLLVHKSFGGGPVITFSDSDIERFEDVVNKALGNG